MAFSACVGFAQAPAGAGPDSQPDTTRYPVSPHRPKPRHPIAGRRPTFQISGCQEITAAGYYTLTADIHTFGLACMKIHDAHNVTLDCDGHFINGDFGYTPITVKNVAAFTLTNCSVINQGILLGRLVYWGSVEIETGEDIALTYNNIGGTVVYQVSRGFVSNNQIVGYAQYFSHDVTISQNTTSEIALSEGYNNQVLNNTIDGKWDGVIPLSPGEVNAGVFGVVLYKETADLISENDIGNFWEAGIALEDSLANTTISMNSIHHVLGPMIEAFGSLDWQGIRILDNQADDVAQLFTIRYLPQVTPPPPTVHFENNSFVGNDLAHANGRDYFGTGPRSLILINSAEPVQILVDNNVFENNTFGLYAPQLTPATGFIDGGGNICYIATDGSPITCH